MIFQINKIDLLHPLFKIHTFCLGYVTKNREGREEEGGKDFCHVRLITLDNTGHFEIRKAKLR